MFGKRKEKKMTEKVGLVAPWTEYYRKVQALFSEDPNVDVSYDDDKPELVVKVRGESKADAIAELLPTEMKFGNVTLGVKVIPANFDGSRADLIARALDGNGALVDIHTVDFQTNTATFVSFKKEVIQYYNDDMGDLHGLRSTLMQEIAKEVLGDEGGIYFCTDNGR